MSAVSIQFENINFFFRIFFPFLSSSCLYFLTDEATCSFVSYISIFLFHSLSLCLFYLSDIYSFFLSHFLFVFLPFLSSLHHCHHPSLSPPLSFFLDQIRLSEKAHSISTTGLCLCITDRNNRSTPLKREKTYVLNIFSSTQQH